MLDSFDRLEMILVPVWSEFKSILIEVLVPLGWQVSLLVVVLLFQKPLKALVNRLRKANRDGFEFSHQPSESVGEGLPISGLVGNSDSTLGFWIQGIKKRVSENPVANAEEALIDALAVKSRAEYGQYILRFIFGSQLELIYRLYFDKINVNLEDFQDIIDKKTRSEGVELDAREMLKFLIDQGLCKLVGEDISITELGSSLAKYFSDISIKPELIKY